MTLLRRAPREVYRVYGEEEFLAGVDREDLPGTASAGDADPHVRPMVPRSGASPRRTMRVALLAACLGVGVGLLAMSRPQSGSGGGSRPSPSAGAVASSTLGASASAGRPLPGGRPVPASPSRGPGPARSRRRRLPRPGTHGSRAPRAHPPTGAGVTTTPAGGARLMASAGPGPQNAEKLEFGFER
jgi:hypothetical protein